MPSDSKPSQRINISGSTLSQVQMGGQAAGDMTVNQSQQVGTEAIVKELTPTEVAFT